MNINGKTAIVTGGASGLGEATAIRFHEAGANVVIADLNEELGTALAQKLGSRARFVKTDVTSEDDVKALCAAAAERFGAVHILANVAGIGTIAKTLGKEGPLSLNAFRKTIEINLIGTFNVLSNVAWMMSKNEPENDERGVIINVASVAGYEGQIGQIAYASSKAGVIGMTITAARDLSSNGIRVCTIVPGTFMTPMVSILPEPALQSLAKQVPFPQRLGDPVEFASLAQHIVENGYLNGECIRIDGAIRMGMR
ncbi:MAG: SDR family NAD(P)-dependent oxidoreductase [Firmicutes bacterium]|nr:SDR family NAD(P)-dependent oxidoreductase [Bacillota bacterium]